jgi:hypothetical protein
VILMNELFCCFFSWWCVVYHFGYACMFVWVVKNLDAMGNPIMRSLFWVFKHVLPRVSPPIVLFTRPYIVGLGISFVHLLERFVVKDF